MLYYILLLLASLAYGLLVGLNILSGILAVIAFLLGAHTPALFLLLVWLLTFCLLLYLDTPGG
jgi:hypothetical protein